jgi:PAS domain S-box-containing protein
MQYPVFTSNKPGSGSTDWRLLLIGLALGLLFWFIEAIIHILFFDESDLFTQIVSPPLHEVWMRLSVLVMFVAFALYANRLIKAWINAEKKATLANTELSQIFETSADGMRIVDSKFNILRANDTFSELVGLDKKTIIGQKCSAIFKGEYCNTPDCPLTRILNGEERVEYDMDKIRLDRSHVPCIVTATPFRSPEGEILGIVEDFKDISERRDWERELTLSRERLRKLASHLQSIREEERRRVAREIHDELGQELTALKMDIHWLKRNLNNSSVQITEKIDDMQLILGNTVDTVRRISSELRPGLLDDFGLSAAIEWQLDEFQSRTGIECKLYSSPAEIRLDDELSIAMFRILQESLTNIAKHANATCVTIELEYIDELYRMRIEDNGDGISADNRDTCMTFGLIGMQERVHEFGGHFQICRGKQKGTVVQVEVRTENV